MKVITAEPPYHAQEWEYPAQDPYPITTDIINKCNIYVTLTNKLMECIIVDSRDLSYDCTGNSSYQLLLKYQYQFILHLFKP